MTELRNLRVLVVDDNVFRSVDIKRALEFNGVHRIALVDNQAAVWELLETDETFDLIVTDMHYPLTRGAITDYNAGFILIEQMKEKGIHIEVFMENTKRINMVIDNIDMLMFQQYLIRRTQEGYVCDGKVNKMAEIDELAVDFSLSDSADVFEYLGNYWGWWHDCPDWKTMQHKAKEWFDKYTAEVVKIAHDTIWFKCIRSLEEYEVDELIKDFTEFAPNSQDIDDMESIRADLLEKGEFVLWWD